MDETRMQISQVELLRAGPEVAIAIHVAFKLAIDRSYHSVTANIELSIMNQQRLVQVLLHDGRAITIL